MKDIGFTGVFRLIFKPLVEELPCFGAVCYSLRQKVSSFYPFSSDYLACFALVSFFSNHVACQKKLDFRLKVIGGEISAVPGISDALEVWQYIGFLYQIVRCHVPHT